MSRALSENAKSELGNLIINSDDLVNLLAQLPKEALHNYPLLQKELVSKHPNVKKYKKALKSGKFTKEEYRDRILSRIDVFSYNQACELNLSYLTDKVNMLVGDDIDQIDELEIPDIGVEIIWRILRDVCTHLFKKAQPKNEHPFLADRGRIDHKFWKHAEKAYQAYNDGYHTHASLDAWCQLNLQTRCPQSFIRWIKLHGDPRDVELWQQYL